MSLTLSAADLASLNAGTNVAIVPPGVVVTPPPAGNVSWVYHNGVFNWSGDWSFSGNVNYKDTSGKPAAGFTDILFNVTGQWGGWLPYTQPNFDTTPYGALIFSFKPTIANQLLNVYFLSASDTADGNFVNPFQTVGGKGLYGPIPTPGAWGNYVLPLNLFALTNKVVLKFALHDETGLGSNSWYVNDVGFQ